MSDTQSPHLVIAFARCAGQGWQETMQNLPAGSLKNLRQLMQGMKGIENDRGDAFSLSPPHERVQAKALGLGGDGALADGLIPWAAQEAGDTQGRAWAWVTPCHWAMGREHATLTDTALLGLTPDESSTLRAAMQPYFETEGITLHPARAAGSERWLAEGDVFRHLPTASLDRVLGRNVDAWLPDSKTAPSLRRLQNEMQMLLYTHPLNDARSARGLPTVNSFWLSGTGALPSTRSTSAQDVNLARHLAQPAFSDDWVAYGLAWGQLDATLIAGHLARQSAGESVRLTLCGECHAQTFETTQHGLLTRISRFLSPQPALQLLQQL